MANVDLVRLLLAAGGDPNRKNLDGTTPLTWCSTAALTEMLIEAGASARYECGKRVEFSSLHNAAGDGDVARLRLLIERGEAACLFGSHRRNGRLFTMRPTGATSRRRSC
jgi:ankyrin repeat protein